MIRSTQCGVAYAALLAASLFSMPAFAQAPTEAQRAAIRSECRSDYEAHCASIQPGGAASLQCLQKNMANLSAGCANAVRAAGSPTESGAEPGLAGAAAPPVAATTAFLQLVDNPASFFSRHCSAGAPPVGTPAQTLG